MKKIIIYTCMLFGIAFFQACDNDDVDTSKSIFEAPATDPTEFDKWLLSNYTYPYNVNFKYRMEDLESSTQFELAPATPAKALIMAKLLKFLWLEVYDEVAGVPFTRSYVPRIIHLIGSGGYNSNNTVRLGSAEGGMKITLYRINELNKDNLSGVKINEDYMKTVHHEFAHILHQTKNYSVDYQHISGADYISDDWSSQSNTELMALEKGFISKYSRKEPNEDFVEILSHYITRPDGWWEAQLERAGEVGADLINQKFAIVKDYLNISWDIDIEKLREVVQRRSNDIHKLDFESLN